MKSGDRSPPSQGTHVSESWLLPAPPHTHSLPAQKPALLQQLEAGFRKQNAELHFPAGSEGTGRKHGRWPGPLRPARRLQIQRALTAPSSRQPRGAHTDSPAPQTLWLQLLGSGSARPPLNSSLHSEPSQGRAQERVAPCQATHSPASPNFLLAAAARAGLSEQVSPQVLAVRVSTALPAG